MPQIGDASGIQSPLSFGGFGAMTRHLRRLTGAVTEAVQVRSCERPHLHITLVMQHLLSMALLAVKNS